MDFGPHAGFIAASYLLCLATVLALIGWVVLDKKNQDRALKELEDQGITRASSNDKG